LLNLTIWPFLTGFGQEGAQTVRGEIGRYATWYLATSLVWDLFRAGGNILLITVLGVPALRALGRFQRRMHFARHYSQ
jgi:energy-coupling factor transport system substrate-specific component